MRFREFRHPLQEAKVGREYQHLEDLVFVDGSEGALQAANILEKLGQDTSNVAIKWDGCIHPDLLIETDKGKLRIEDVIDRFNNQESFSVLARNLKTDTDEFTPILNAIKKYGSKIWVEIVLENEEVLRLTEDHKVYTTNRGWIQAKDLTPDDDIKTIC